MRRVPKFVTCGGHLHSSINFSKPLIKHGWDLDAAEAIRLQKNLAAKVINHDHLNGVRHVAGVDVAYDERRKLQFAAAVVLDAEDSLSMVESAAACEPLRSPYIPGLFSFRELPTILHALRKLKSTPDLITVDGHGVAHPRRFGLACHLGVMFDIPTIGCSKTRLIGMAEVPGGKRADYSPLFDGREIIGRVLRTRDNVKPVVVSVGHLVSLPTACDWILRLAARFRLPETTRQADHMARKVKNSFDAAAVTDFMK
jgi:deoxyribonuclease V